MARSVPEWVFCSEAGTSLDERNLSRAWFRLRRRAQRLGVRPLKLHCTRHTYASMALASGKSVKWTAEQRGHSSPMLTLKTYAHVMPQEDADLSFADFGAVVGATPLSDGAERLYPALRKKEGSARHANPSDLLVELGESNPRPRAPRRREDSSLRSDASLRHVARQGPARGCTGLQPLGQTSLSVAYT